MNTSIMHACSNEAIRPMSNDDRRAHWAQKFYALGFHRRPDKPRIRVTVPEPLSTRDPAHISGEDK